MDGDFAFRVSPHTEDEWLIACGNIAGPHGTQQITSIVKSAEFMSTLRAAGDTLLKACANLGWSSREIDQLNQCCHLTTQSRRPPCKYWFQVSHPVRRHLILVVRRDRDFVISNRQLIRYHLGHNFAKHKLTVLAACAESYPVFATAVSFLIARPLSSFRAAQAQPINSRRLCRFGF